ncbi:MAG: site-2 protease family protein [Candidatus Magasanikbacteria bacterium]|nr:site-2 protease family protein [Candidatus Magasanikbacteria bacterium]
MDWLGLIFYFVIIIPSSIIHEYAHGFVADALGDPTARYAGRLTIDPRVHIDRWGTILLPLFLFFISSGRFLFAYAKPVPYNPYNLSYPKWGPVLVGIAGPAANFLLAATFALVIRLLPGSSLAPLLAIIVYANLTLMVFNLVPVPPLDGSKILYAILPDSAAQVKAVLDRYGFVIVFVLVFFFFRLLSPVIEGLFALLVGQG